MHRADEKSKLSRPPVVPVVWEVRQPLEVEGRVISRRGRVAIGSPFFQVRARTWFEARAKVVVAWAQEGVYVNPQAVREGRIVA